MANPETKTADVTAQEVRQRFLDLPDETQRAYEVQIVSLVMDKQSAHFQQVLETLLNDSDDKVAFAAFCALCEVSRRKKNYTQQQEFLAAYGDRFQHHPFISHIRLLYHIDNFDYDKHEEILTLARENSEALTQNAGAHHAFADLVATAFEHADSYGLQPPAERWLEEAAQAVQLAVCLDPKYAKFYCTKARLLALRGDYDQASLLIKKAVDLEDSEKTDYPIRISGYLNHLQRIQAKNQNVHMEHRLNQYMAEKMTEYAQGLEAKQEELNEKTNTVMNELQNSMSKNLEFIGLFAGIISFTIGSISISSSLAGQSFTGAAGLIVVLMGALLCVFAGFGVVLHGFENKKWKRNLVVFLLGLAATAAGLVICFCL